MFDRQNFDLNNLKRACHYCTDTSARSCGTPQCDHHDLIEDRIFFACGNHIEHDTRAQNIAHKAPQANESFLTDRDDHSVMCDLKTNWGWLRTNYSEGCVLSTNYGVQVKNVVFDLRALRYQQPMNSVFEDGGRHRPNQVDVVIHYDNTKCSICDVCQLCSCTKPSRSPYSVRPMSWTTSKPVPVAHVYKRALIMSRFDDHNPFFQLSLLFNAWGVSRRHGAQVDGILVLGENLPQPIDELWTAMFGVPVGYSANLPRRFAVSTGWLLKNEYGSPITQQLDAMTPPCLQPSPMIMSFFHDLTQSMRAFRPVKRRSVTFIRRVNYASGGKARRIGRILLNEERVIDETAKILKDYDVRGIRMETMSQAKQISIMQESEVVIGMHGAGMVNVGFMHPGPQRLVVEIFPNRKRRWGYRNLCHYLNMSYIDYRKGQDYGGLQHKTIDLNDWRLFIQQYIRIHDEPYYATVGTYAMSKYRRFVG